MERLWGDGNLETAPAHALGGGGVLPLGGRCLWSACGGWQPPTALAWAIAVERTSVAPGGMGHERDLHAPACCCQLGL